VLLPTVAVYYRDLSGQQSSLLMSNVVLIKVGYYNVIFHHSVVLDEARLVSTVLVESQAYVALSIIIISPSQPALAVILVSKNDLCSASAPVLKRFNMVVGLVQLP
jgi:hypothetical protein